MRFDPPSILVEPVDASRLLFNVSAGSCIGKRSTGTVVFVALNQFFGTALRCVASARIVFFCERFFLSANVLSRSEMFDGTLYV